MGHGHKVYEREMYLVFNKVDQEYYLSTSSVVIKENGDFASEPPDFVERMSVCHSPTRSDSSIPRGLR